MCIDIIIFNSNMLLLITALVLEILSSLVLTEKKKKNLNLGTRILPLVPGFSGGQTVMNILQNLNFIISHILIIYFRKYMIMLAESLDEKANKLSN